MRHIPYQTGGDGADDMDVDGTRQQPNNINDVISETLAKDAAVPTQQEIEQILVQRRRQQVSIYSCNNLMSITGTHNSSSSSLKNMSLRIWKKVKKKQRSLLASHSGHIFIFFVTNNWKKHRMLFYCDMCSFTHCCVCLHDIGC